MKLTHSLCSVFLAGLLPAQATAFPQDPGGDRQPASLPFGVTPVHSQADDPDGNVYGIWAAGEQYKVSFHGGMTFVPYLGSDYPTVRSVSWRTTSVTVDGLEMVTRGIPSTRHTDTRFEYDHGGVVEAYDVLHEGLEQTFVLARPPARLGDLVVTGRVTTNLAAANTGDAHGPLSFVDRAGRPIVGYGAAFAVDAAGRRTAMRTRHENGEVTLTLSGEWLREAAFPVVVDPLLTPAMIINSTQIVNIDILRDDERNTENVWIARTRTAAANDHDLWVSRHDDDFSPPPATYVYTDLSMSWNARRCQLAFVGGADKAVLVYEREILSSGNRRISWHAHDNANLAFDNGRGDLNTLFNEWRPDIGGRKGGAGTEALIVFQTEPAISYSNTANSWIQGMLVDFAGGGQGTPGSVFTIAQGQVPDIDYERPRVNQVNDADPTHPWIVAYQQFDNGSNGDWSIAVEKVLDNGFATTPVVLDDTPTAHEMGPIVEGRNGRYLVAYSRASVANVPGKPIVVRGYQLRAVRVDWPVGGFASVQPAQRFRVATNDRIWLLGGLGHDTRTDSHWVVSYKNTNNENVFVNSLGYTGRTLLEETVHVAGAGETTVVGGVGYDDDARRFPFAYGVNNDPAGFTNVLMGGRFEYSSLMPASTSGVGCSAAAIDWYGSQQLGSEFCGVEVTGAPPGSAHFLIAATNGVNQQLIGVPPVLNGCWLLVPNIGPHHLGVLPLQIGSDPRWQISLPETLANATLHFQDFHTDASLTVVMSTQRLTVELGK